MSNISYSASYASRENANISAGETGYDFEATSDSFASAKVDPNNALDGNLDSIPANNTSDLLVARNSNDKWTFKFLMDGIGEVTAESYKISYSSNDRDADDEGLWWKWVELSTGNRFVTNISRESKEHGAGTLGSLMSVLTGEKGIDKNTPGLLNQGEGGAADSGGTIYLYFNLKADNKYSYGAGQTGNNIGDLMLSIKVYAGDSEQDVLDRINTYLNSTTRVDIYTDSYDVDGNSTVYNSSTKSSTVDHDVYDIAPEYNDVNVNIHAGASKTDKINMRYKCLRLASLELMGTNVLTEESATKAIDEVSKAITIVSKQRSQFGAYQNRLEHAKEIDDNSAENTAAAESRIRDADMADLMVEHSIHNILMQAGQNMLAQANQSNQGVLSLLI